jgi:predicted helicase
VYLTNSLTGWGQEGPTPKTLGFPGFNEERDLANHVKRDTPILVILGNPPYNSFAGIAIGEERDLTNAYREAVGTGRPQGQGLNDLYVRFFSMAERQINKRTGRGVVCYISNYSWLDGLSFTATREQYMREFDWSRDLTPVTSGCARMYTRGAGRRRRRCSVAPRSTPIRWDRERVLNESRA